MTLHRNDEDTCHDMTTGIPVTVLYAREQETQGEVERLRQENEALKDWIRADPWIRLMHGLGHTTEPYPRTFIAGEEIRPYRIREALWPQWVLDEDNAYWEAKWAEEDK